MTNPNQGIQQGNGHGWGADRKPEDRPGVPREADPPHAMQGAHWTVPERQTTDRGSPVSITRKLTPVYSSANPPRGLSGMLRRAAYRYPEYKTKRWALLMLADRIDVIEHNSPSKTLILGGLGAATLLWLALRPKRESRRAPRLGRPPRARAEVRLVRRRLEPA